MSAMDAEALAAFPDPRAAVLHPIVNDWFDTGYEAGKLDTGALTNRILAALPPCGHEAEIAKALTAVEEAFEMHRQGRPTAESVSLREAERVLRAALAAGDGR